MKLLKAILAVALVFASSGASFYAGRKTAPRLWVLDLKASIAAQKAVWAPLNEPDGTRLYVASPDGAGPGVVVDHAKPKAGEPPAILVFPPELAQQYDEPAIQPQADHERLDHAGTAHRLLRTSWGNLR